MHFHKLTQIEYIIISHIGHNTKLEISYNILNLLFFLICPVWLRLVSVVKCIVTKECPKHLIKYVSAQCGCMIDKPQWDDTSGMKKLHSNNNIVPHDNSCLLCPPAYLMKAGTSWSCTAHAVTSTFQTACLPETLPADTIGFVLTGPTRWGGVGEHCECLLGQPNLVWRRFVFVDVVVEIFEVC